MTHIRLLLVLLLAMILIGAACGDDNSGCNATDCKWNDWEQWNKCDKTCGSTGTQLRQRSKNVTELYGGMACDGEPEETRPCNRVCYNSGTVYGGACHCTRHYYGSCCENLNLPPTTTFRSTPSTTNKNEPGKNVISTATLCSKDALE